VITLPAPLERPYVVSQTVETATIVLISGTTPRVVNLFFSRCAHCGTEGWIVGGGCTVAPPFGGAAGGKNCKDITNVDDVTCDNGACKVLSCKNGFKVHTSGDSCVKPNLRRRQARVVGVIDEVFSKLVHSHLLVPGFDIVTAKQQLLLTVKVLDYDHILEALLAEDAIIGIHDLAKLKEALGLGPSIHRRNPADIDSLFNLIVSKGLFVNGFDVAAAKARIAALGGFDLDRALGLLLSENAFVDIHDIATLKARLGLN